MPAEGALGLGRALGDPAAVGAATIAFVLYIPTRTETGTIGDMTLAFELAAVAMALNLVMGYGGIVSLGHSAYFGLGAYTMAVLVDHYGWTQGWTFYVAAVFGFVSGVSPRCRRCA